MKKFLLLSFVLTGCTPPSYQKREYPTPEARDKAAAWIQKTCEVSNPKSDEEPEDMIEQAEKTALNLFGVTVRYVWKGDKYVPEIVTDILRETTKP